MRKVFSVGDNCVDQEFMIQGSSEPLRHLSYIEEQLEEAVRRANDEGKAVSVLQWDKDLDSTPVGRDKTLLHGVRVMPLVQRECDNKKGGGAEMESAAEVHIEALVEEETERIIEEHGLFNSDHEAWAVIQEEIEEAQEDMDTVYRNHRFWWERIRANDTDNLDMVEEIEKYSTELIKEAVQVAACCRKYKQGHLKQWVEKQVKRVGGQNDAD